MKEDDIEPQCDNIFHIGYHVNNKVCSLLLMVGVMLMLLVLC